MSVIGVDLGIHKVAIAYWEGDVLLETDAFHSNAATRPEELYQLAQFVGDHAAGYQPDDVWIEDTLIGNNRKYSINLSQTMGAVLSELASYQNVLPMTINTVNVSTWKKGVLGNGHADKLAIRSWVNHHNDSYSELCGDDQDRFDAACIGYYGLLISRRVEGLRRLAEPG